MVLLRLQKLLTPRRLQYALLIGAAFWLPWFISVAAGPGNMDLAGHPVGADYIQFHVAGYAARTAQLDQLYDFSFQWYLQRSLVAPQLQALYAFINPPHFAALFAPFSALPYGLSFALWSLLGIALLFASLRLQGMLGTWPVVWSLTWYVVYSTVSYGQNALLSLFILAFTYWLWQRRMLFWSGLALSLLAYKPQLMLGVMILWIVESRTEWKSLLGAGLGVAAAIALSFVLLPQASAAYFAFARTVLPSLPQFMQFPIWNLHTFRGFWLLLLPDAAPAADVLALVCVGAGLVGFLGLYRRLRDNRTLSFAAAVGLTWWLTPHAMIYDLAILLLPACLLWLELPALRRELVALYAVVWFATFVSAALSLVQIRVLHFALQVSVPTIAGSMIWLWRALLLSSLDRGNPAPRYSSMGGKI